MGENRLKTIGKNQQGAVMIELVLVLPLFVLILYVLIEGTLLLAYQTSIDSALQQGLRESKVSTKSNRNDIQEQIKQKILGSTFGLMNPERLVVTTDVNADLNTSYSAAGAEKCYDSTSIEVGKCGSSNTCVCSGVCPTNTSFQDLNGNGICDAAPPVFNLGGPGDVIAVTAIYRYRALSPALKYFFGTKTSNYTKANENIFQTNDSNDVQIVSGILYRNER